MGKIKFPYDNFLPEDICGMYTFGHFFMIALFIIGAIVILHFTTKFSERQIRRAQLIIAIAVTSIEIIKMILRGPIKQEPYSTWIPLYFCSLFIFAIWFTLTKNEFLWNIGCSFITMGGIFAAVVFVLYPSTSLAVYPLWHPESFYSYAYHLVMFCTGVTFLATGYYKPRAKHSLNYLLFMCLAAIPSIILNSTIGTNCLFLADAYGLFFLQDILNTSPVLYAIVAFLGQAVLLYWGVFGIYKLILKAKKCGIIVTDPEPDINLDSEVDAMFASNDNSEENECEEVKIACNN